MKYNYIPFEQPIGSFILTVMPANEILRISKANPRKFDNISLDSTGGIQRQPSTDRIKEIANYANTVDASFPTAILLAIDSDHISFNNDKFEITGDSVADIVDGQHRLLGLKQSEKAAEFNIPVVFIMDAQEEQKALIFAIINGKQTKVPASIIYDLFGITEGRSPQKTSHEIARAVNSMEDSPWHRRLKMLGKKTGGSAESLSQGTFIKFLLPYISSDPVTDMDLIKQGKIPPNRSSCIFNDYFLKNQDSTILKILLNMFKAARNTWSDEWNNPSRFILSKTTGYSALMLSLPLLYKEGISKSDLTIEFFEEIFGRTKIQLEKDQIPLTSDHFASSSAGENKLSKIITGQLIGKQSDMRFK